MIIRILFIYWIFSTIFVGLSLVSEKDSPEIGVIVRFISILFGWLILSVAILFDICERLKKKFL